MARQQPKIVTIEASVLARLREEGSARLAAEDATTLVLLIDTFLLIGRELQDERATIARMLRLFGLKKSEKSSAVLGPTDSPPSTAENGDGASAEKSAKDAGAAETPPPTPTPPAGESGTPDSGAPKSKRKGHGRLPASAYPNAQHTPVPHGDLQLGDRCPGCRQGALYLLPPAEILRIVGQAPLAARCWVCERFRCSGCQAVYTAKAPVEAQGEKFTESAASMMAILRYGSGLPIYRSQNLQHDLGTPIPASTHYAVVKARVELVRPAFEELLNVGAQVGLFHTDDTHMPVLQWMGKRRAAVHASGQLDAPERTGLFTTGIVAVMPDDRRIAMFFTGRLHAGENLAALLARRAEHLPPPMLMSDALARKPEGYSVVEANCLTHARRNFVEQLGNFPVECRFLLGKFGELYGIDDLCKTHALTADQRLEVHKRESAPILDAMRTWMTAEFDANRVEKNSGLGAAFTYMLKRWEKFTVFVRVPGAPLDNTLCERVLKKAILHRKNSLFYRSQSGAAVGDIYMTLIHTAELNGKNPFEYLTALMTHADAVRRAPSDWLPWTYEATLVLIADARLRDAA